VPENIPEKIPKKVHDKIDIHTHLLPKEMPNWAQKFGAKGFISLKHTGACNAQMLRDDGSVFREVDHRLWDEGVRLKDCDQAQVKLQVLSTVPVMFSYGAKPAHAHELARFLNDQMAEMCARTPSRFVGLGTVPLQDPELAAQELKRCMTDLKLRGVQIGSSVNDWSLSEPKLFPFYAEAEKQRAAIFVHPWDMPAGPRMTKYWLPWLVGMPAEMSASICSLIFGGVFEKFPKLRFAFAHGGGAFPGTIGRIEHGFKVRPDLCAVDNPHPPSHYLGKFLVDALVHDPAALQLILEKFGEECVAMGSDYPFPLGEHTPGQLIESIKTFSEQTKQKLFKDNALRWLGLQGFPR